MGATTFCNRCTAESAQAGFRELARESEFEYGNDPYNGTISTTSFRGVHAKIADKVSKTSINKGYKAVDKDIDHVSKWDCYAIDCGVDHYEVITMKKDTSFKSKGAPTYRMRFVLANWEGKQIGDKTYENQTEAKNALMKMFAAGKVDCSVRIVKKPVLVSGQGEVAYFAPQVKTYKSKPKSVPAGAILKEYRTYLYYGWAGC